MFQKLLKKIARILDRCGIPYMVIGGQALLIYGEPRLTKDIDITLEVGIEELEKVKNAVEDIGLKILPDNSEDFVEKTMVLPVVKEGSGIRVDFIFSFSPYERQAIERARPVRLGRTSVKFASLEDVIIHKIIAGRPRDIEDIKSLLLKNPGCNKNYIEDWLEQFDRSLNGNFMELFKTTAEDIA